MPPSKLEKLTGLLGGEDKLPPKIQRAPQPIRDELPEDEADPSHALPESPALSNDVTSHREGAPSHFGFLRHHVAGTASGTTDKPGVMKSKAPTTPASLPCSGSFMAPQPDLEQGKVAPLGLSYVPILAAAKFPYKFVAPDLQQHVATAFFDAGKFWKRDWSLYYIYSCYSDLDKPVIFISESQFQTLLDEINAAFLGAKIAVTEEFRSIGLVQHFDFTNPNIRPRWLLGRCNSKEEHDRAIKSLFERKSYTMPGTPEPDNRSIAAFKRKMEAAAEVAKNKSKATKAKKREELFGRRHDSTQMLKRAQRYLGLLAPHSLLPGIGDLSISPIDVGQLVPYPFDQDVIVIAIDVEAYERDHKKVTEVGVATLDTRDLVNQAPGRVGENWHQFVRGRHFRVEEYKHLDNTEFVHGCAANFEFGGSEFVRSRDMSRALSSCFNEPFSRRSTEVPPTTVGINTTSISAADWNHPPKRNIILLGHDLAGDILMLNLFEYDPRRQSNPATLDTANMSRSYFREPNAKSLGGILYEFDLSGWHLHNAGNDAVYTIWAMLAMCVKEASERGSKELEERRQEAQKAKMEKALQEARERVLEESWGWNGREGKDGYMSAKSGERGSVEGGTPEAAGHAADRAESGPKVLYTASGNILDV